MPERSLSRTIDRRALLRYAARGSILLVALGGTPLTTIGGLATGPTARAQESSPTPGCQPGALTPAQTEGPYYRTGSPERSSLIEPDVVGTRLVLGGSVLGRSCRPIPGAWLDFWQADGNGAYDNRGFRLRGHQLSDENGRYTLETVLPGEYPGRAPHIHVKVQAPGLAPLTTQVYFPDQPRNQRDGIFDPALLAALQQTPDGPRASFDFVLDVD